MPGKTEIERIFDEWFEGLADELAEDLSPLLGRYKKGELSIYEFITSIPSKVSAQMYSPVIKCLKMLEDRVAALEKKNP